MTIDEFYAALAHKTRKTGTVWNEYRGLLRAGYGIGCHCPLSFVAGTTPCDVPTAESVLGLPEFVAVEIAAAADKAVGLPEIRRRLLHACGLLP